MDGFLAFSPELNLTYVGFNPESYLKLSQAEEDNFWFRARNDLIVWAMRRYYPDPLRYLEVGCGTGYVLRRVAEEFPNAEITGSEVFTRGLVIAAERAKRAELLQMDARNMPYHSEFDVIGAYDVLEHIPEDEAVLEGMIQALRPGGIVVITVPQHPWLWSQQDEYACHVRRYRVGELRQKVLNTGFKVELETSFVSLLLPTMLISRLGKRKPSTSFDPLSELHLPILLNRSFELVMRLERKLIAAGMRFPIGGSCLLVARKALS